MTWCFDDEASPAGDAVLARLAQVEAVVPMQWQLEVTNVLLVAERRGKITEAQAARFLELLGRLPIQVDDTPVDITGVLALGRRHGLSAYDAQYLWLAERRAASLATLDGRLAEAARAAGVPLLLDP